LFLLKGFFDDQFQVLFENGCICCVVLLKVLVKWVLLFVLFFFVNCFVFKMGFDFRYAAES